MDALVELYKSQRKAFSGFMNNVIDFFAPDNEALCDENGRFFVHSVKHRIKKIDRLAGKISRKIADGRDINSDNLFQQITDFCGVRVIHLRLTDFDKIHSAIMSHVAGQHWCLFEDPKAYTWDPEYKSFFERLNIRTEMKESFYTSVHYVVKPNSDTPITCEIQVRSLFEEVWGEIDRDINYPDPCPKLSCREQLKVLAKLVGAGTKLVDSIYSSLRDEGDGSQAEHTSRASNAENVSNQNIPPPASLTPHSSNTPNA